MGSKITPSSGNVFADLGFEAEEAEHLRIRSDLMIALRKLIQDRNLTQAELESKLLAALGAEATSMGTADWDQLRERVRRMAAETREA